MGPLLAAHTYNSIAISVLGYIGHLHPPPVSIFPKERAVLHHMLHLPTNSFELSTFFNLKALGCKNFTSVDAFCKASLIRTAKATIKGWETQYKTLQNTAEDTLSLSRVACNELCTAWWDSKPFVYYLHCASFGRGPFEKFKHVCDDIRTTWIFGSPWLPGMQPHTFPPRHLRILWQAFAMRDILASDGGYSFYELLQRRCAPLGLNSIAVLSRSDVQNVLNMCSKSPRYVAMSWLKTSTNAWCTSSRMHESPILPCIFGCKDATDVLSHYLKCDILWSLICEAFVGDLSPCLMSRMSFIEPTQRKLIHIACAFEMYHALKIGQRHVVDAAIVSGRFSEVIRVSTILADECSKKFADVFSHETGLTPEPDTGQVRTGRPGGVSSNITHILGSNVGALRRHPRRQMYNGSMRTPRGPRPSTVPMRFTSADHIDFCPSWRGISSTIDPDSDLDP